MSSDKKSKTICESDKMSGSLNSYSRLVIKIIKSKVIKLKATSGSLKREKLENYIVGGILEHVLHLNYLIIKNSDP